MSDVHFIRTDNLIVFAKLMVQHQSGTAAYVAVPDGYFHHTRTDAEIEMFFSGMMSQGMKYNLVLRLFDSWNFLDRHDTAVTICGEPIIVLS